MTEEESRELHREISDPSLDFDAAVTRLQDAGVPRGMAEQRVLISRRIISGDDRTLEDEERAKAFFAARQAPEAVPPQRHQYDPTCIDDTQTFEDFLAAVREYEAEQAARSGKPKPPELDDSLRSIEGER